MNSIKDRLYNVDFNNKVMRGVNVEAVRCVVGRDDFSTFFRPSQILKDSVDPEIAVQLMSPMDGVRYCHMCGNISECLSPTKSFKLSESRTEHTNSPLLLDNVANVEFQGPNFCGYNITFERDWYKCDRQAAKDMREFCDYESKESETTVSRKMLHVPEVAEDDKDLEY